MTGVQTCALPICIARLLERTTMRENPAYTRAHPDEWSCRIEVTGRGGKKQVAEARHFRGHAKQPLSDQEIERKFRALARKTLPPLRIDGILRKAWSLEALTDIDELLALVDTRLHPGEETIE